MSSYPLFDAFLSMLWFFLWIMWLFLVGWIIADIIGNRDISGLGKAGWILLVVLVPLVGVLIYMAFQGVRRPRAAAGERRSGRTMPSGTRNASATELSVLADLHDRGVLNDAEFERGKEKILR